MSAVPAVTASMPAEDPMPDTSTFVSGCVSVKALADSSAMGSNVVEPLTMTLVDARWLPEQPVAKTTATSINDAAKARPRPRTRTPNGDPCARPLSGAKRSGRWPRRCTFRGVRCCTV